MSLVNAQSVRGGDGERSQKQLVEYEFSSDAVPFLAFSKYSVLTTIVRPTYSV